MNPIRSAVESAGLGGAGACVAECCDSAGAACQPLSIMDRACRRIPIMPDTMQRLQVGLARRYRVDCELGSGGMATVYLAHDLKHCDP
jgi:hypothetical protein